MRPLPMNRQLGWFNIVMFLVASVVIVTLVNLQQRRESLKAAEETALLLLDRSLAVHSYFNQQLKPHLFEQAGRKRSADDFDPTWMSSTYAVREIDRYFRSQRSNADYYYKEAAINARNPENEADDYERSFIRELERNPQLTSRSMVRTIDGKPYFQVLRRVESMEQSCLRCHSNPAGAPSQLVARYGATRSFQRHVGEVVSAISIRIPLEVGYVAANRLSLRLSALLVLVLGLLTAISHYAFRRQILQPIVTISNHALEIITDDGKLGQEIPPVYRTTELVRLIEVFNDMSRHLRAQQDNLTEQVRQRTSELELSNKALTAQMSEMQQMRTLHQSLLDAIPNPAWLISRERRVLAQNSAGRALGSQVGDYCWAGIHGMMTISTEQRATYTETGIAQCGTRCKFCLADMALDKGMQCNNETELEGKIWDTCWVPVNEDHYLHYAIDVTERRHLEREMAKNREFLAATLENIEDGIVACDANGILTFFNRSTRRFHGLPSEPLPPERWVEYYDLFEPDGATPMSLEHVPLYRALRGEVVRNQEMVIRPKYGPTLTVLASGRQLTDQNGTVTGAVVSMHDTTTVKRLEDHLRQAQKMESVGTLAGGVAHDFNNILTVIIGAATLLNKRLEKDPELGPVVDLMRESAERAARLTQNLLAFSRHQPVYLHLADLNHVVVAMQEFLKRLIGENIRFECLLTSTNLPVMIDRNGLEQVLMNLAINARDAMGNGGRLLISTSQVRHDGTCSDLEGCSFGDYAIIEVSDSGRGIATHIRSRIFEPFFTTKEMGKGTGLGLSVSYGIVRQHKGTIGVESRMGEGTTFRIYLPLSADSGTIDVADVEESMPVGTETILIVEDDEAVRKVNTTLLEKYGYRVLAAVDGEQGVKLYHEHSHDIALVLLDVIMPGLNGREVYELLVGIDSQVKVLFMSGYTADILDSHGVVYEGTVFLQKPLEPGLLLNKVRELIDSA